MKPHCFRCGKTVRGVRSRVDCFTLYWIVEVAHLDHTAPCIAIAPEKLILDGETLPDNPPTALLAKYRALINAMVGDLRDE